MGSTMSISIDKVKHQTFITRKLAVVFYVECPFYITADYCFSGKLPSGETGFALQFFLIPGLYSYSVSVSFDHCVSILSKNIFSCIFCVDEMIRAGSSATAKPVFHVCLSETILM